MVTELEGTSEIKSFPTAAVAGKSIAWANICTTLLKRGENNAMRIKLLTLSMLVVLAGSAWSAQNSSPSQNSQQKQPNQVAPAQEAAPQTAVGQLSKIDTQKQLLWIKTMEGQEMQFSYTKDTPIQGSNGTVEGLAAMSGTQLKVQFRSEGGVNHAISIEVQTVASK
jgi:hypothetical protein